MAVINSDVSCSFRFIEFENGSNCTVCTAVHKTSLQYSCTQNHFTVQLYTKPVYSTAVHNTSLQYCFAQNQFTVPLYTKPVYRSPVTPLHLVFQAKKNVRLNFSTFSAI